MKRLPNTRALRASLIVGYSSILQKARKGAAGLARYHLFSIMLLGDNGGSIRIIEAAKQTGQSRNGIHNRFVRVVKAGFIENRNRKYYLTDSGQVIYNRICVEFDKVMADLVKALKERAAED